MLYLHPPFHIIRGVSLLRDHIDPLQWYFLPMAPQLPTVPDPVAGVDIPQLQLIRYRGSAGNGGFLNFDVHLGLEEERLEDVRRRLRDLEDLDDLPRLAPVPLVDGTVRLLMLGRSSDAPPPEDGQPPDPSIFEVKMSHFAKPSLYGDNRAAFSVEMDQEAVTVVEAALQGEIAPMAVIYSLEYLALRPAYSVRLQADWDRVQTHLEESFGVDTLIFSSQIDEVVDELIEDRVIVIEADTFIPEGDDQAEVLSRRDQAVNEVREMVTDTFFTPSIDPLKAPEPDGWDRFADTTARLSQIAHTGGLSESSVFSYKKVDLTRIDRKSLSVDLRERTTITRHIHPQGHVRGLFRVLRDGAVDLDRFVIPVDLDAPWFERRTVEVVPQIDFTADGIETVQVELTYGDRTRSLLFEAGETGEARARSVEWASDLEEDAEGQRRMVRPVTWRYTVRFAGADGTERPRRLESPELVTTADRVPLSPRDLYSLEPIPITPLSFPWDRWPHVSVRLRYDDEDHGIHQDDTFLLDQETPEATWRRFVLDPGKAGYERQITFHGADHQDLVGPWETTTEEQVRLRDPFPRKRTVEVIAAVDWNRVRRVFVDLAYRDPAHDVFEEESLTLTQEDDAGTFSVDLVDPDLRRVSYQATVMFTDGSLAEIPRSTTLDRRIFVTEEMRGHRIVEVRPEDREFAAAQLREMQVDLRFLDGGNEIRDRFVFTSTGDLGHFEFDYSDDTHRDYEYKVRYLRTDGLARSVDWKSSDADVLVLDVPQG